MLDTLLKPTDIHILFCGHGQCTVIQILVYVVEHFLLENTNSTTSQSPIGDEQWIILKNKKIEVSNYVEEQHGNCPEKLTFKLKSHKNNVKLI